MLRRPDKTARSDLYAHLPWYRVMLVRAEALYGLSMMEESGKEPWSDPNEKRFPSDLAGESRHVTFML